jgi:hypothetical protein
MADRDEDGETPTLKMHVPVGFSEPLPPKGGRV